MKIRHGFVSNSSSSSFVIGLTHEPKSVIDMQSMLFDKNEIAFQSPWSHDHEYYPVADVSVRVLEQLKKDDSGPLSREEIIDCLCGGWLSDKIEEILENEFPYENNITQEENRERYRKSDIKKRELVNDYLDKFLSSIDNKNLEFFEVEFNDGDGPMECAMEHGDLFKKLPHICVSKH